MRILAFSDLHRDTEAARAICELSREADVVVGAGDFATRGRGAREVLETLHDCACPFVFVHGNHDDPDELAAVAADWPDAHLLHGSGVGIDGVSFFGLGGEVPVRNEAAWNAGLSETEAAGLLDGCPEGAVLVTHNPPWGHCDGQADGSHEGSRAILHAVQRIRPVRVLCGHIHNAWGQRSQIESCRVHNIGPTAAWHLV